MEIGLVGVIFSDGHELGCTVYFAGGGVNHAFNTQILCGLDDIERAFDVRIHVSVRGMIGIGNGNERCKVQYDIAAFHCLANAIGVAHISREDFKIFRDILGRAVQPSPRVEGVIEDKGTNGITQANQVLHKVGADKAVGPSNENFFPFEIHCVSKVRIRFLLGIDYALEPILARRTLLIVFECKQAQGLFNAFFRMKFFQTLARFTLVLIAGAAGQVLVQTGMLL